MLRHMNPHALLFDGCEPELPPSPIRGSDVLVPLRTWAEILEEHRFHGVDLDAFWYESLAEGVCFFYRWARPPRAIVLVITDDGTLRHIECRNHGHNELSANESAPIVAEIVWAFAAEGIRLGSISRLQ